MSTFQAGDTVLIRRGTGDYYLLDRDDFVENATEIMASIDDLDATAIATGIISNLEFEHLDGVTSNIQTQLGAKQTTLVNKSGLYSALSDVTQFWEAGDTINLGAVDGEIISDDTIDDDAIDFTDVTLADLTFDVAGVTTTELGYLDGVTSNLQTQIDSISAGGAGSTPNLTQATIYATGYIETPQVKVYPLILKTVKTGTILELTGRSDVGTCAIQTNINDIPVGLVLNVSPILGTLNYTSGNTIALDDTISLEVYNNTNCAGLAFTITGTEINVE